MLRAILQRRLIEAIRSGKGSMLRVYFASDAVYLSVEDGKDEEEKPVCRELMTGFRLNLISIGAYAL
ncbi:hypothetical protein EDD85DRAFT_957462 [Armillaria nabsnona]|nr:hypothetical protein EDD85DRAFT_957462 [Armillaria nabsnona]